MADALDNGIDNIIVGVICQAVRDWQKLCREEIKYIKNKKSYDSRNICYRGETFQSIIDFFNSDYGYFVCDSANIAPDRVISWLKSYRKNMINDAIKKGKKHGKR